MFYNLLYPLHDKIHAFNVFRYITFRFASAMFTALLISFIFGPSIIRKLKELKIGQQVREDGPETHLGKAGTPTMGGILILLAIIVPTLLWSDLTNRYVWLVMAGTLAFGAVGFYDDYLKVVRKKSEGLRPRYKMGWQILIALLIGLLLYFNPQDPNSTVLLIPFFKRWIINLAWFYVPFVVLVLVGASNAVNLTDGLDGLAIGLVGIAAGANAIFVYVTGNKSLRELSTGAVHPRGGRADGFLRRADGRVTRLSLV